MRLPTLSTKRLTLRPLLGEDGPLIRELAGDKRVAETTLRIPHPYPEHAAEAFIATLEPTYALGKGLTLGIELKAGRELIGCCGVGIAGPKAELGYWIAHKHWNNGYATEAAGAFLEWAFTSGHGIECVHAFHFEKNPASGKVMEKLGMRETGPPGATAQRDGVDWPIRERAIHKAEWRRGCGE